MIAVIYFSPRFLLYANHSVICMPAVQSAVLLLILVMQSNITYKRPAWLKLIGFSCLATALENSLECEL